MVTKFKLLMLLLSGLLSCFFTFSAVAENLSLSAEEIKLEELFDQVTQNPEDLDINFAYANQAVKMGKFDEALASYERMLIINPDLARVKLDMALVYMQLNKVLEAEKLFNEVLALDPPENVQSNINKMLVRIEKAKIRNHLSGSVAVGFNHDTNASSSPSKGSVDLFGFSVSLDDSSRQSGDDHLYGAVSVNHSYIIDLVKKYTWDSSASFYKTRQSSLINLNLTVWSIRTGPTFTLPGGKTKISAGIGFSDVNLGGFDYLLTSSADAKVEHVLHPKVKVNAALKVESREFRNSPNTTTYSSRSGRAWEGSAGFMVAATPKDIFSTTLGIRKENTEVMYNNNRQHWVNFGFMHVFPNDYFLNLGVNAKITNYKGVDTFISPTVIRSDSERGASVSIGKKLSNKVTLNLSYQVKAIDSNLQNYEYDNERVGVSLLSNF